MLGSVPTNRATGTAVPPHLQRSHVRHPSAVFEYVGRTGLTVVGPVSGRRYRFEATGARVAVDTADMPSLTAVPQLRLVARP
jgi:hypothetical protein